MIKKILLGVNILSISIFAADATTKTKANVTISANLFKPITITSGTSETVLNITKEKKGDISLPEVSLNIAGTPGKTVVLEAPQILEVSDPESKKISLNVNFGKDTSTDGAKAILKHVLENSGTYTGQLSLTGKIDNSTTLTAGKTYTGTLAITAKYN